MTRGRGCFGLVVAASWWLLGVTWWWLRMAQGEEDMKEFEREGEEK